VRYEVAHEGETWKVEVSEVGPGLFDVCVDAGEPVRVDASSPGRGTTYSILIGERQYEASVDEREGNVLDVHVGTSAFDFEVIDERRKRLALAGADAIASGPQTLRAQMSGKIVKVLVTVGQAVSADEGVVVIEAMKMENELRSPIDGVVTEVGVSEGDTVETDALLVTIEPPEAEA
jgi:biotin carboxyl carrier protein